MAPGSIARTTGRPTPACNMAILVFAVLLAMILGFAAHRASICTVRTIAEIMSARTGYMLASVGKSVLWVWAVTMPIFLLMPALGTGVGGWSLTVLAMVGGFAFGVGAALNGGCAFSTMARLVDGEGKMLATVGGFAVGVFCFVMLVEWQWLPRPAPAPALIGELVGWAIVPAFAFLGWAVYESVRLWRTRETGARFTDLVLAPRYRLSTAALLIGFSGALLFLAFGAFGSTATFGLIIEGTLGTRGWPPAVRWILLIAMLTGMLASTVQRGSFRIDWRPRRVWLLNLSGGMLMGFGTALAPGGNDVLILYGIPTLSPHALPAYMALAIGVAAGLMIMRLWLGVEARVTCRNDTFVSDTWTRPIPGRPKP
jgi:uncharacterized membrane protein YedE/YeeE